mmetsp:Transcript_42352/g.85189  ORF Transcript_42352/g.85189 Transcript_42352/m.85189 type:complete len:395 (-) Transcript_42352:24-1208(-)
MVSSPEPSHQSAWGAFGTLLAVVNFALVPPLAYLTFRSTLWAAETTPSGFRNAPVSRAAVSAVFLSSVAAFVFGWPHSFSLPWGQIHAASLLPLLYHQLYFPSLNGLACGMFLLYKFRQLERAWGSRRFLAGLLLLSVLSSLLSLAILVIGPRQQDADFPGGGRAEHHTARARERPGRATLPPLHRRRQRRACDRVVVGPRVGAGGHGRAAAVGDRTRGGGSALAVPEASLERMRDRAGRGECADGCGEQEWGGGGGLAEGHPGRPQQETASACRTRRAEGVLVGRRGGAAESGLLENTGALWSWLNVGSDTISPRQLLHLRLAKPIWAGNQHCVDIVVERRRGMLAVGRDGVVYRGHVGSLVVRIIVSYVTCLGRDWYRARNRAPVLERTRLE